MASVQTTVSLVASSAVMLACAGQWGIVGNMPCDGRPPVAKLGGTYESRIDQKGRLTLPAVVRPILGDSVVLSIGVDPCVLVYTQPSWQVLEDAILRTPQFDGESRWLRRALGEVTEERPIDGQGRVLISERLRRECGLYHDVLVIGVFDKLEVWDPEVYRSARSERLTPEWRQTIGDRL